MFAAKAIVAPADFAFNLKKEKRPKNRTSYLPSGKRAPYQLSYEDFDACNGLQEHYYE